MALKLKKDVKKSSYYVWFLGAKESKGLRGLDYIRPVIGNLEEREKDIEPFKVTLQISPKGLKIVQNIVAAQNNKKPKNETIKHFIPHNTITCVHQQEDIIACILLLFNPVTKCPLHVHAYRCDSLETATILRGQLQLLIEKPENQKRFAEIESRLVEQQQVKSAKSKERLESSIGSSDTGTSTKSESSEERFSANEVRVATLYDSVAAELRAKLKKNNVPILLPPRDYDTVHRQKGNLTGIELRRCLNVNIVGQNVKAKRMASSGGSSGIGSDHAPSPETPDQERYHDGHSTSDEDWNADQDTGLYLIDQPTTYPSALPKYDYRVEQRQPRQFDQKVTRKHLEEHIRKKLEQRNKYQGQESFNYKEQDRNERNAKQTANNNGRYQYEEVDDTLRRQRIPALRNDARYRESRVDSRDARDFRASRNYRQRDPSTSPEMPYEATLADIQVSPRERFNDAKEKFLLLEKHSAHSPTSVEYYREMPISPVCKDRNARYYDEDPVPAPRNFHKASSSEERDRRPTPLERYRVTQQHKEKNEPKRRSMFNLSTSPNYPEDMTLRKDFKRRSYMEQAHYRPEDTRDDEKEFKERPQRDRQWESRDFREVREVQLRDKAKLQLHNQRYRNSYAEPPLQAHHGHAHGLALERKFPPVSGQNNLNLNSNRRFDILHRTNSTVSNNGRVGIASVHPY